MKPAEAGFPVAAGRRVKGLRREELASLARMSPDYYTRLEQGRHPTASAAVLDSLARALQLSAEDRSHLYALAKTVDVSPHDGPPGGDLEALRRMLEVFGHAPAVVCGPFADLLAVNDGARFLFDMDYERMSPAERNSIHWMLTSPTARELYNESWEQTATDMIGKLRSETGRMPHAPRARALVAQLSRESELFRRVWGRHEVSTCVQGSLKVLHHRLGGVLHMRSEAVTIHTSPDQVFYVLLPVDDAFEKAYLKYRCR